MVRESVESYVISNEHFNDDNNLMMCRLRLLYDLRPEDKLLLFSFSLLFRLRLRWILLRSTTSSCNITEFYYTGVQLTHYTRLS